jgi:hypothetical protein
MENKGVAAGDPFAYAGRKKYQGMERVDRVVRAPTPNFSRRWARSRSS